MCGLNGITTQEASAISDMNQVTAHRGPDSSGTWSSVGITLGHNRLAVIDLSVNAAQPMHSNDGRFTVIFNGEIYNFQSLRTEIGDRYQFKTSSDTEVILAGYSLWGESVFNKLRGMFALAIWDQREKSLLLVRDQLGVKPLYYSLIKGVLYFSSELGGIITGTNQRQLDPQAVTTFLELNYVPSPSTLLNNVHKLRPAHLLRYQQGAITEERYWQPKQPRQKKLDPNNLRSTINQAVNNQLVADRPVGVLLSGGLDSSIVLHHAAVASDQPVKTYSAQYELTAGAEHEADKFNTDAVIAAKTASLYGAKHQTHTIGITSVREQLLPILESVDEPVANPTTVAQFLLHQWVRQDGTVVALGGDGGDELFGGYTRHRIMLGALYWQRLPRFIQTAVNQFSSVTQKLSIPIAPAMHRQLMALKYKQYQSIGTNNLPESCVQGWLEERYAEAGVCELGPIDAFMRVDRESWLADESLHRSDCTSMAHGLESRVPLLDLGVVELADSIFGIHKYTPWNNKRILKDAYRGQLPDYLFNQPKRGWISPGAKWFRDPVLQEQIRQVLSEGYYDGLTGLFDWSAIQTSYTDHVERRQYNLYPLWNVLTLQVWAHRHNIRFDI